MGNRMGNWMSNWMGNRLGNRMTNRWGNRMTNRRGNRMTNRRGNRMATEEQPKSEEYLPFQGKTLECKNQFFVGGIFLFDGYWRGEENGNADAELERVKLKTPNLKKQVAIRRIKNEDCLDGWTVAADKLICLNHNNILRVFGYEEDVANGWRYFALEPYSATLYEYCDYEYNGPMPNESQVLYQITNGVSYLHGKGIVHGDLNPLNVVIAAESRPVRMKISDFGLSEFSYSKQLSQKMKEGEIPFEMELCLRKYWYCYWSWTLSKKTDSLKGIKDASEDVIAAGCILFYYLKRGEHLFGNDFESILINLKKKNPVNLPELGENHFAYEPIKNMINPPGKGFNWLHIANEKFKEALSLQVNTRKLLGSGTFGQVFEGKFNGDLVAVKQMTTTTAQKQIIQREMNTHIELNHVNVVKLLDVADSADNRFTQLVLELCPGTLADWADEKKYSGPKLPPDELVLYQIANGLHYIHSRNLVHRDIKPENILISMTTPVQMKVSDLSFVKKTRDDIFSQSKIRGTLLWMAPERLKVLIDTENMPAELPDGTIKSDTFSSGCVFFYFLTRGKHPFGKNQAIVPANISQNKPEELVSYKQKDFAADDLNGRILVGLVEEMIQFEKEERIGLPEVIKQLSTVLYEKKDKIKCQFQSVDMSLHGKYSIRFHPTKPIVACADNKELIFYTAENSSIPFSNWRKEVRCLPLNLVGKRVKAPEWNINGTQLAFGGGDGTLVVWSYPKCEILFQRSIYVRFDYRPLMEWNPTRPNLFATFLCDENQVLLCDSSVGDVITTIDSEGVRAVNWISENRIAVSSFRRTIQIFEIDEKNLTINRLVKEFSYGYGCHYLEWNERTQYLASVGGGRINIWSMDHDTPIYSMKTLEVDEIHSFAWRPCIGNGEEKDGIEMARKSVKNFFFAYASISNGVFIWNPLESEQQPRRLSEDTDIGTVAFSSNGRFLAAGSRGKLMIWSAEDWEQIDTHSKCNDEITDFSWLCTKTSTNLYENKLIVNHGFGPIAVLEYAFEESEVSDSANQILTESN